MIFVLFAQLNLRKNVFLISPLLDIDECSLGTGSCPSGQECVNTPGAYRCRGKCADGFVMAANDTCFGNVRV